MTLKQLRQQIDEIDTELARLLIARFGLAVQTMELKKTIVDVQRERQILKRVVRQVRGTGYEEISTAVFRTIIEASTRAQKQIVPPTRRRRA